MSRKEDKREDKREDRKEDKREEKKEDKKKLSFSEKIKEFKEVHDKELEADLSKLDLEKYSDEKCEGDTISSLETELEASKLLAADYLDKLRRNMAEFDNFRKRTIKEKTQMYDDGIRDLAERLLPVIDNFELAISTSNILDTDDNFYKGVDMILRQFKSVFFDLGIEEIQALGAQFDPNLHNAFAHTSDDAFGSNEVIEEMRKGYKFKDKVLRHSMVKVAN